MFRVLLLLSGLFFAGLTATAQLTIEVTAPENTPENASIYVAGTFNNWNPGDPAYKLTNLSSQQFRITLTPPAGLLSFKFTRGSWDSVEGSASGGFVPNRLVTYDGSEQSFSFDIAGWEDTPSPDAPSTAGDLVFTLTDSFWFPSLGRYRRIQICLPNSYQTSELRYPVLYMHDGQNLFDKRTAPFGEWEVDESINVLEQEKDLSLIVVGIDHGESDRIPELTPWPHPQYGGGKGDAYLSDIVFALKPHIDSMFRTLPDAHHTGIFGSSLGGLISAYAFLKYPQIFGKAGVFSPAFWINPEIFSLSEYGDAFSGSEPRMYMMAGGQESVSMVPNLYRMRDSLINYAGQKVEIHAEVQPEGRHNEGFWAREFPDAVQWLFRDCIPLPSSQPDTMHYSVFPNPATEWVTIFGNFSGPGHVIDLIDTNGRIVLSSSAWSGQRISLPDVPSGVYQLRLRTKTDLLHSTFLIMTQPE
jgi:predicted alpha/beta superfamily hydrolase